uniref:trigger factor n=1 Tax=Vaginimicrobium propionicum TaxID=1871034 RepID=UPI0009FB8D0F|nr:trigger factor [Vaginimicrobium propionicum]
MPSAVEQINPTRVKLTIEVPFAELEPAIDQAYKQIANQVNLPGFRKGKVPPRLIDQRFGRGVVLQEAINDYLPTAYASAVKDNEIHPLGQPEIDITELDDGNKVIFSAEVDVRPEFELPNFSEIFVEVPAVKVDDEVVNQRVELLRTQFADLNEVDRAGSKGDVAVFNLTATKDGNPLEDAEAKDMQYRIGDGGMIDGLDEALEGMKAGDSKSFSTKLVGGSLKDVQAEVEVEVSKVMEQKLPELNDDFSQLVSEFDTVDEMIDDLRENLVRMSRLQQANAARELVLEEVVKKVEFELPAKLLEDEKKARHEAIENQLKQAGLTVEEYLKNNPEEGEDPDAFWTLIDKRADEGLRAQIILDQVADTSEIPVSQEELTALIIQKAQQSGRSAEEEMSHMLEHNHMGEWMGEVRRGKALGQIVAEANIADDSGAKLALDKLNSDGTIAEEDSAEKEDPETADQAEAADSEEESDSNA